MKKFNTDASLNEDNNSRPRRLYQIDSLLQHELGLLFTKMLEPPLGSLVSISSIKVTPDFEVAEIKLSIIPFADRQKIFLSIKNQLRDVSHALHLRLRLYRVPRLNFIIDETEERADRLEQLINQSLPPSK